MIFKKIRQILLTIIGLIIFWQSVVWITGVEPFLLPSPDAVISVWWEKRGYLLGHARTTTIEMCAGLLLGTLMGSMSAVLIASFTPIRRWLFPILVVSQAVPVFAIAPLLVLWFGYGLSSKIIMTTIIIYFPVTTAFLDGLRRTEVSWIELSKVMTANRRNWSILWYIRIPSALPSLASGLRVAAAVAPIGAVVGEWVGSSSGLGYAMLHANARMQTDLMFASLSTLAVISLALYFSIDWALRHSIIWLKETDPASDALT